MRRDQGPQPDSGTRPSGWSPSIYVSHSCQGLYKLPCFLHIHTAWGTLFFRWLQGYFCLY